MPKPKDGAHRQSQYPGICRRYSAKLNDWQWGYRLNVASVWVHVHPCASLDAARTLASQVQQGRAGAESQAASAAQPLLANLFQRYLDTYDDANARVDAARALRRFAGVLTNDARLLTAEHWLDLLKQHGTLVVEVRKAKLSAFVDARRQAGAAPASINREMNSIAAALHRAEDWYEALEQWKPPKIPRLPVDQNPHKRLITDAEYARLLAWLSSPGLHPGERGHQDKGRMHVYWILRALMLTGARVGELYKLQWSDVDLTASPPKLTIRGTKTARKKASVRQIVITPQLREVLDAQRPYAATRAYIFTQGGNHSPKYYKIIRRACEALDIPYGRDTANGLLLRFARHTTATELLRAGIPIGQAGRMLGHDPHVMLLNYDGIAPADDARALAALEVIEARRLAATD